MKKLMLKREFGIFVLLVVLCVAVSVMNPKFLSAANLQNMARLIGMYGIFSIGVGLVIMTGGIDFSIGSMISLLGVILPMALLEWHFAWPLAVAIVLLLSIVLGWVHAWFITRLNLQPFIITLCGLLFYRGIARFVSHDETKGFGNAHGFETLQNLATTV